MNSKDLFKKKPVQIGYCIFSLLLIVYCVHGFVGLVRQTHTRAIAREFTAAVDELKKSPPGVERAQVFVKRLKAINPGYASPEMKQALQDYIAAMEQGVEALKARRDSSQYDAAAAGAKQRMITCVRNCD